MNLWLLSYHRRMLNDRVRVGAWQEVLRNAVRPGDVVVDVGAGTGLLSLLSCAAGAGRVYAIEGGETLEIARDLARRAGFENRITFCDGWSSRVQLPERADVVVGDLLAVVGLNGNLLGALRDAKERFLKPGGTLLPQRLEMECAPVEVPEWHEKAIGEWSADLGGFDHRSCRSLAVNAIHGYTLPPRALLAQPVGLGWVDLVAAPSSNWRGAAEFRIERPGVFHALGGWHTTWLDGRRWLSNSPLIPGHVDSPQGLFPIESPVEVGPGDVVTAMIRVVTHGSSMVFDWKITVRAGGSVRARFQHSTLKSEIPSLDRLQRGSPAFVPRLSARATAARDLLDLCDGSRSVGQLRHELQARHGGSFAGPEHVADFVSRLVNLLCP